MQLQISTCDDLLSSGCEVTADGEGTVQTLTQVSDTIYEIGVQVCSIYLASMHLSA